MDKKCFTLRKECDFMKKQLCSAVLALGLLVPTATPAIAASSNVNVSLPSFDVTLNGTEIDNDYSQYPLIVYKDITYFPMTYYDCRFLGLETGWTDAKTGLFIDTTGIQGAYHPYTQKSKNAKSAKAQIASFPITVNGKAIDNSKEEHPLLLFRDVTYFPMTWRFCVDEFNWQYSFTTADGLIISSGANAAKTYGTLPQQSNSSLLKNVIATDGKYVYYAADEGFIMSAPLTAPSQAKAAYQLPINYYIDNTTYCTPYLYERDGKVYLSYHIGGGIMGNDCLYTFNDKGEAVELDTSSHHLYVFGNAQFKSYAGPRPYDSNLLMLDQAGNWQKIGSSDYIYGWDWKVSADGGEGGHATDVAYYDGSKYFYIPAFKELSTSDKTTGIHRIDVTTNETVRITPEGEQVAYFTIDNGNLYYFCDNTVYRYNLQSGATSKVYALPQGVQNIGTIQVLNNYVYLSTINNSTSSSTIPSKLLKISPSGQVETIEEAEYLSNFTVKDDYLVVLCPEISQTSYRLIVIDKNGKIVFKSADPAVFTSTYISDDVLYYYNTANENICSVELD